jgi:arylsulfatase A-like enzyme
MAGFKASVRVLDQGVGTVMDALDQAGLADDTLVICTTDHGIAFPGMKCTLTDHGLGVMLIMRGPGGFSGGKVVDGLVSQIDVFPTICDLLDIEAPPWLEGRSFMPLVTGEKEEINEQIFAEINYHASYEPQRAVRTSRWKYIKRFADRETLVMANVDDSPSKELWLNHGWRRRKLDGEYLFDLVFDPNEANNLAGDPEYSSILDDMRDRMGEWMRRTDDPLLSGRVPAPNGATVNDPDSLTPSSPTRPAS